MTHNCPKGAKGYIGWPGTTEDPKKVIVNPILYIEEMNEAMKEGDIQYIKYLLETAKFHGYNFLKDSKTSDLQMIKINK